MDDGSLSAHIHRIERVNHQSKGYQLAPAPQLLRRIIDDVSDAIPLAVRFLLTLEFADSEQSKTEHAFQLSLDQP